MEKLKLLIVDDEYLIRNLIKMRIDWNAAGIEIIGEAGNAQEALALVDKLLPDIILTDICMPYMDGIEFSRIVFEKYPHIKIVIITGHDEFEYVRKSIKLGIADFLLKPIKAHELTAVIDRLKLKIEEEHGYEIEFERMKEKLAAGMPVLREKFLNELVLGLASREHIFDGLSYFEVLLDTQCSSFQVAVAEFSRSVPGGTEEDSLILEMKCSQKAADFFNGCEDTVLFSDSKRRLVILCGCKDINLVEYCDQLKINIVNSYKCFADFGVSTVREGFGNIHLCYREACNALDYRAVSGKNQVIYYEDAIPSGKAAYRIDFEKMEKLNFYISAGAARQACGIVEDLLDGIPYSGADMIMRFRLTAMDILSICSHIALEQKIPGLCELCGGGMEEMMEIDNLPDIKERLLGCVDAISTAIGGKNRTQAGNLICQVKKYLHDNMQNPELGLSGVSAEFFVSPGHLGRLMKQETGQTFVEYLTGIRIKRAEQLLLETDMRGYQVGEQVGICDPHYFSILFKKCTGMSVNAFRNMPHKEE